MKKRKPVSDNVLKQMAYLAPDKVAGFIKQQYPFQDMAPGRIYLKLALEQKEFGHEEGYKDYLFAALQETQMEFPDIDVLYNQYIDNLSQNGSVS